MAEDFGSGVSRTLSAKMRQFANIVFQADKPPLDSELNLMGQVDLDNLAESVRAVMPSGFVLDPTRPLKDYEFNSLWSNQFRLGTQLDGEDAEVVVANVNGWIIPVIGTDVDAEGETFNTVRLYPPPETDSRVDFVFLEAWQAIVEPNPSEVNKPSASTIYKYGNVQYGGDNLVDDLEDPAIGLETTKRVQVQYRLRVFGQGVGSGQSVDLEIYPDGLGDPNILGMGASDGPVAGFQFENMREALGDPSLWRAGDGDADNDLGTVDGYTYAIPVCAIFRRNSGDFLAVASSGNGNQNGGFNRKPGTALLSDPLTGSTQLLQATLANDIGADQTGTISITNLNGSGLEDDAHVLASTFLVIDGEIIGLDAVDDVAETINIPAGGRGRWGTDAVAHEAGTVVEFYNNRPDGLYSDQVAEEDVLDLRRGVNPGDWDYTRLLMHNLGALVSGDLRTAWKKSGAGDDEGVRVMAVDYLLADGGTAVPNQTDALDGPDGIRTIWSDAATLEKDVTLILDNEAPLSGGFTSTQFDANTDWDVAPDFEPVGFMNLGGALTESWTNGSSIFLHLGGASGSDGARTTFRDGAERAVRFITPKEWWKTGYPTVDPSSGDQHPVSLRFLDQLSHEPPAPGETDTAAHPGPQYPWSQSNFERPFIVLGAIVRQELADPARTSADLSVVDADERIVELEFGVDFDAAGVYYSLDSNGRFTNDGDAVSRPMLRGRTLYDVLTDGGSDRTGASSELYMVLYGDADSFDNNGAFKVLGAGTVGYTSYSASTSTSLVLQALSTEWTGVDATGNTFTAEMRSPYTFSDDGGSFNADDPNLCIVLTDIGGLDNHPWNVANLNDGFQVVLYNAVTSTGSDYEVGDILSVDVAAGDVLIESALVEVDTVGAGGALSDLSVISGGRYIRYGLTAPTADTLTLSTVTGNGSGGAANFQISPLGVTDLSLPVDSGTNRSAVPSKMVLNLSLLYHPGRGGTSRVADRIARAALVNANQSYLRQNPAEVDSTFAAFGGNPVNETPFDVSHVQTWNRLDSLGWSAPDAPGYGGRLVGFTEQDRESELFVDTGSKTLVFRPFRNREMTLQGQTTLADPSLLGSTTYPNTCDKDEGEIFTTGKLMGFPVPPEYMPRFGRQDIPYHRDLSGGSGTFLEGINHLFTDSTDLTDSVFNIIGGPDNNSSGLEVTSMYFVTDSSFSSIGYAKFGSTISGVPGNTLHYGARKVPSALNAADPNAAEIITALDQVRSSDIDPPGLKGIQLPPYLGIARLYGVYDARDYVAKGGRSYQSDRTTPEVDPAINLLRKDATKQTLFILQDGAKDHTEEDGDHTYIIPETALDITKSPDYVDGETFDDIDFIVECTIFGFSKDWINGNNYVLARYHDGAGDEIQDGDDPLLEGVRMTLPSAAGRNDAFYVAYNRTVYQGDPYMTRHGSVQVTSDYENRYGEIPIASARQLAFPIEQYDENGDLQIETPNLRAFEVLASVDFYTTMGTGNVGGMMYPGTRIDVGHTQPEAFSRIPAANDSPKWHILTRAFTEGQKENPSRASVVLDFLDNTALNPGEGSHARVEVKTLDDQVVQFWAATEDERINLISGGVPALSTGPIPDEDIFLVDENSITEDIVVTDSVDLGSFDARETKTFTFSSGDYPQLTGLNSNSSVVVVFQGAINLTFHGWVSSATQVSVNVTQIPDVLTQQTETISTGNISDGGFFSTLVNIPGHASDDGVMITRPDLAWPSGFDVFVEYVGPSSVRVNFQNESGVAFDASGDYVLSSFKDEGSSPGTLPMVLTVSQRKGQVQNSARNFRDAVNAHPDLERTITARLVGQSSVELTSVATGAEGNDVLVSVNHTGDPASSLAGDPPRIEDVIAIEVPTNNNRPVGANITDANLFGGTDLPVNAGSGTTQLRLTGMTERLPLGILLQDADFLGENPLGDKASAVKTAPSGVRPVQTQLPLTEGGEEVTRFLGAPGTLIGMSDGAILQYAAAPTVGGVKRFRLYRGGGSLFMASGDNPGGPLDWVSESLPFSSQPVLKGGILTAKVMLVRNFYEEALATPITVSHGDEIQMVVMTYGILGDGSTTENGITLSGSISPTGYGEGYAAADRYRINGRPMFRGRSRFRTDLTTIDLTPFPEAERTGESITEEC